MNITRIVTQSVLTATAGLGLTASVAAAFNITPNNDGNTLLNMLLGNTQGLSNFSVNVTGSNLAFGLFDNDPLGLGSGLVMSTGKVTNLAGPNLYDDRFSGPDPNNVLDTDLGQAGDDANSFDLARLDISFDADASVEKLVFDYVFGSEEFFEWAGMGFNDSFELLLNGVNLALLSDGRNVSFENLFPDPFYHPDFIDNTLWAGATMFRSR